VQKPAKRSGQKRYRFFAAIFPESSTKSAVNPDDGLTDKRLAEITLLGRPMLFVRSLLLSIALLSSGLGQVRKLRRA
jgi:hypothetical protein